MTTYTQTMQSFTSARGNKVVVRRVKTVGYNGMFSGFGETVRVYAEVCGTEVEVDKGAAFKAVSAVADAGF